MKPLKINVAVRAAACPCVAMYMCVCVCVEVFMREQSDQGQIPSSVSSSVSEVMKYRDTRGPEDAPSRNNSSDWWPLWTTREQQ